MSGQIDHYVGRAVTGVEPPEDEATNFWAITLEGDVWIKNYNSAAQMPEGITGTALLAVDNSDPYTSLLKFGYSLTEGPNIVKEISMMEHRVVAPGDEMPASAENLPPADPSQQRVVSGPETV